MTESLKPSVRFGVDWETITPEAAVKVPLVVADSVGGLHLVKDREENTPLHLAAAYSKTPGVIDALAVANDEHIESVPIANRHRFPDCTTSNAKGDTPLMVAVRHDNVEAAASLVNTSNWSWHANFIRDTGTTIFWAADNVRSSEMAYNIASDSEVDWDARDEGGDYDYTPLQYAVLVAENIDAVKGFLNICPVDVGAYSDEIGSAKTKHGTILHLAVMEWSSGEMIKAIIDAGVDVNYLNKNGMTALDYVSDDDWRVAEVLRKAGGYVCDEKNGVCFGVDWKTATAADVAKIDKDACGGIFGHHPSGNPIFGRPIDWAVRFCPDPEVIEALIPIGVNFKGLLMTAAAKNPHPEVMKAFIAGNDVNEREGNWEQTPLHYAVRAGHAEVAACLIQAGADVNSIFCFDSEDGTDDTEYQTPLDIATEIHGPGSDITKMLVAAGAISAVDSLMLRTANRNDDEISRLLDMPDEMRVFTEMAEAEGWNPGLHDGACYHIVDESGFLIGANGGEDIATVSAVRYGGGFGFLGFYIVRADMRGRGFGLRMWRAAMERLQGCAVVGLDGVAGQRDNYAKSGFDFAFLNVRREFVGGGDMPPAAFADDGIVDLSALAFDDVAGYLLPFFPAPRHAFYRAWIGQAQVVALGVLRAGGLVGVGVMRKCRRGRKVAPLFADDDDIADRLLRALKARASAGEPLFMDMPDINPATALMARRYGMKECFSIARMYKGKMPVLPTDRIYAITSPEIG